ncbi:MAG: hypothetical protein IKL09_08765, partial [Clostridia bacterium]|nr:hypothetical protein [Clostridia bacterium]
ASVLGYGPLVRQNNNAIEVMSQLKLLKGLNLSTDYLSRGDGINLLYNMCMADSLTESEYSEDGVIYKKERSILEKNLGIYYGEGVVTSNYTTSLYAVKPAFKTIGINNESYELGLTEPGGYLGVNCEYFYKIEDGNKVLVSIYPSAKTESVVLKSSQNSTFKKISTTQVIYRDVLKDEDEIYDLSATAAIIYNGVSIDRPLSDVLSASTFKGAITLIDNDKDDVYDCMKIDHGRIIVVDQVNNDFVYDKLTNTPISVRNERVFFYKGNNLTMADEIGKNSVLTLYQSANQTGDLLFRFRMSENTVLGKITSISNGKVTVDKKEYGISSLCQDLLEVGSTGVFKLDDFDEVVCLEPDISADVTVGFLMDTFQETEGLNPKTLIKVLIEGEKKPVIYEKAPKVCVDGVTVSEEDEFYNGKGAWVGVKNLTKKKPILYRLNSEGKLTMLDTELTGTGGADDKLTKLSEPKTYRRLGNFLITVESIGYMNRFPARNNTKHIVMPAGKDESYYSITTGFWTQEDRDIVTTTPYSIKQDSIFADIIVSENYAFGSSVGSSSYKVPFMFESAGVMVNENGDVVNCIKGREADGEVTYEIDEDFYATDADFRNVIDSLQKGDLIWAIVGSGVLEDARLIYTPGGAATNDAGHQTLINSGANRWSYDNLNGLSYGTLKDPEEGYMKLTLDGGTDWYPYNVNGVKVVICEEVASGKIMISQGRGISSIYSTDKVLMYMADRGIRGLYVYRGTFS